jgi:CRISPR-associated exonuclease Cas4
MGYITPTDVKDYVYCPAIPWLRRAHWVSETPTPSMESGFVDANGKERIARDLGLPEPLRVEVAVTDRELGVRGVIDVVAGPGKGLVILEVKAGVRRPQRHHLAQLKVYVLLAHRNIGRVRRAALYTASGATWIEVDSTVLSEAERLVEAARKAVFSEEPPWARQPEAKCRYCFFSPRCPLRSL